MSGRGASDWSRRSFLGALATLPALPYAARFSSPPRIVVLGGGAFGLWSALHLERAGADVTLIDAFSPGNPRASSGGESRVIRAVYGPDRIYTEMVRRSYELWDELEQAASRKLYTPTGALWMHRGVDDYLRSSLPFMRELGFPIKRIPLDRAAQRWPQIAFDGIRSVYLERRAGALAARECCLALHELRLAANRGYRRALARPGPIAGGRLAQVLLGDGTSLEADHFVFACGPWMGPLFPDVIGDRVRATRQEVYYFGPPAGDASYGPEQMPVWIDFGERVFYGLPDVHGRGFKIADDTRGELFDPTTGDRTPSSEGLARARDLLAERFPGLRDAPLAEARVCQYENSPDGHLIVDRHPGASNVWLVGGGSGHGFKLSPAVGEMVAGHVLNDRPVEQHFGLARLENAGDDATQFDSPGEQG